MWKIMKSHKDFEPLVKIIEEQAKKQGGKWEEMSIVSVTTGEEK